MAPVVYETGTPAFEQRIGTRVLADWISVTWVEGPPNGHPTHGAPREWPGRIQDVSVSGASILGPADLPTHPDGTILLRYRDELSEGVVNRRDPTENPTLRRYGVEWVRIQPSLKTQIYEAVAPAGESPERWDMTGT